MRWVAFSDEGERSRAGVLQDEKIYALVHGTELIDLLGDDGERLSRAGETALADPADVFDASSVRLLPPLPRPPSIRDFYAFEQHARAGRRSRGQELPPEWYRLPVFYFTNPVALIGDRHPVSVPPGCSALDFELEVAAVVGKACANASPKEAEGAIVGFTVMNDWSERDLQREEMLVGLGPSKGKDFATSMGPCLVTADEIAHLRKSAAFDLRMTAKVNGKLYSDGNLADIYWSFEEMLSYASRGTKLVPGDIIGTGTCATGCIVELSQTHGADKFPWLKPGDIVELAVDKLGTLTSEVVTGEPYKPLRDGL